MATTISPWRLGTCQTVTVGAASASTATPTSRNIHAVLLTATSDCHVRIGMNPAATAGDTLVRAGWPPIMVGISEGESVAAIQDSAGGTLYVTELTH